jgi:hypothetical protein
VDPIPDPLVSKRKFLEESDKLVRILFIFISCYFSLKTSFLKWRPDFETAADEYSKAGKCDVVYLFIVIIYFIGLVYHLVFYLKQYFGD